MDATRKRRQIDQVRKKWYAQSRAIRFARLLVGLAEGSRTILIMIGQRPNQ